MDIPEETLTTIRDLVLLDEKIGAICALRQQLPGLGLLEATVFVDQIAESMTDADRDALTQEAASRHHFDAAAFSRTIRWPNVLTEVRRWESTETVIPKEESEYGIVRLLPSNASWPEIQLIATPDFHYLSELVFAGWDKACGNDEAAEVVSALVRRRMYVLQEVSAEGRVLCLSLLERDELPDILSDKAVRLRRVLFDCEPAEEPVDREEYIPGKNFLYSRTHVRWLAEIDPRAPESLGLSQSDLACTIGTEESSNQD